ncbi:putative aldo/keto reductase-like oxidoreductase [Clostridium punense]|uniref:Aldo/keto reductase-like oxidoreductase n=1 Tax=Clostridium punense TaxID=1054297 RepID=A0ABS4JZR3_9CLOT|nr:MULTISPECIES: aldo/keto reductase [Clostridium]EQB87064.1 hypothetical protein M918_11300 [Clostridium sp. BL8]MBP2021032.1 putative aldo/keto reductase-like oxidoreductase [Clostridium punense]
MKYKNLGKTNLKVSVVGFGGIPVQRVNSEETKKVLLKAEELGINFVDSGRGYSVSEEYIGEALEGRRENWILATKSMVKDKESMARDIEISLKNFKTNYIDLYQLHNIRTVEELERVLKEDGAYAALLEAKALGKIKHIGITSHSLDLLKVAIEMDKFETIMYPYNIVENQGEELFKRAKELDIGVIAMKPMAGGALEDGDLALRYILKNHNVTTAIPGMATVEEVTINAGAAMKQGTFSDSDMEKAAKIAGELGESFCRRCGYCAPCPQKIDIPTMFVFSAYKERYNLAQWAEERYSTMAFTAKDCIQCGACEKKCPYDLPIRNMLLQVRKTFNE